MLFIPRKPTVTHKFVSTPIELEIDHQGISNAIQNISFEARMDENF